MLRFVKRPCKKLEPTFGSSGCRSSHLPLPDAMLVDDVGISCKIRCTGGDVPSGNDGMFLRLKGSRPMWSWVGWSSSLILVVSGHESLRVLLIKVWRIG